MENTDRAETVQPWLTKQKSHEIFRSTASTVDIPARWDPQAKQSRTVALLTALRAAVLFESLCTVPHVSDRCRLYRFIVVFISLCVHSFLFVSVKQGTFKALSRGHIIL